MSRILNEIVGKTISNISKSDDSLELTFTNDEKWVFHHHQDCCESVWIDDINGDLEDLIGTPLLRATEDDNDPYSILTIPPRNGGDGGSYTFYHLATIKGYVTIKWIGESNGYYSESVDLCNSNKCRGY